MNIEPITLKEYYETVIAQHAVGDTSYTTSGYTIYVPYHIICNIFGDIHHSTKVNLTIQYFQHMWYFKTDTHIGIIIGEEYKKEHIFFIESWTMYIRVCRRDGLPSIQKQLQEIVDFIQSYEERELHGRDKNSFEI